MSLLKRQLAVGAPFVDLEERPIYFAAPASHHTLSFDIVPANSHTDHHRTSHSTNAPLSLVHLQEGCGSDFQHRWRRSDRHRDRARAWWSWAEHNQSPTLLGLGTQSWAPRCMT